MVITTEEDGVRLESQSLTAPQASSTPSASAFTLVELLTKRMGCVAHGATYDAEPVTADLVLPDSPRWREAADTALLGTWCNPLWETGQLDATALSALRAEARTLHRQLVPVWRRRTRHGRVLSLDADLGGLSLYDLVAADVRFLSHTAGGVFEDERLNTVLRGLNETERQVVFAYAEGEGTTWMEAAASVGAGDPEAFGERVRRKSKRLAREQARRAAARRDATSLALHEGDQQL
ncbi:hypothetical protein ACFC5X_19870 [Streptomyces sp. NPDC055952]|uniref:hypothetical protein n=1 Tax=Streptomyces sp. NPDC055952 TaxID=3345663 RepID=UPI0035DA0417